MRLCTEAGKKAITSFDLDDIGVRFQILHDVSVIAPIVDESELEYRHVNAMKRKEHSRELNLFQMGTSFQRIFFASWRS
jgi:hypothetical protein